MLGHFGDVYSNCVAPSTNDSMTRYQKHHQFMSNWRV